MRLTAPAALLMLCCAPSAWAATTDLQAFQQVISKYDGASAAKAQAACVCQSGTGDENVGYLHFATVTETIEETGATITTFRASCIVPHFDAAGAESIDTVCLYFDTLAK